MGEENLFIKNKDNKTLKEERTHDLEISLRR
jgi:hypothetical protein